MRESIEDIVWTTYKEQSEGIQRHGVKILMPDNCEICGFSFLLAERAPLLYKLLEADVIDLTRTGLSSVAIRAVLDHLHGALDAKPPRSELPENDFLALSEMLNAAAHFGASACKEWIEEALIDKHISSIDVSNLRLITESAHAKQCSALFHAAGIQLAERAPTEVLASTSPTILALIMDRTIPNRAGKSQEIALGDSSGAVSIYDIGTGTKLRTLKGRHKSRVTYIAYAPDGTFLATASKDNTVRLWNATTGSCLYTLTHSAWVCDLTFFTEDNGELFLISASSDQTCKVWNTQNGPCLHTLEHGSMVFSVSLGAHQVLASGCDDDSIRLWNTTTWTHIQTLKSHSGGVFTLAFSPPSAPGFLASGSRDNSVKVWSTDTWDCLRTLTGHSDTVRAVAWSPDGNLLVSGSKDRSFRLWNPKNGECIRELSHVHTGWVYSVNFSLDSTQLLSCSDDGTCCISDPSTGKLIRTIEHEMQLVSLACRPPS